MQTARRRRTIAATALSAVAHVAVLTVVALQSPLLRMPVEERGPPQAIIPILIMPRTPPAGANARPAPIRLHRRPQRNLPRDLPLAPLPAATPPAAAPTPPRAPIAVFHPAPMPEGLKGDVKSILRGSALGCSNVAAVGLTRAERDLCDERLGKGAKDTDFLAPGLGMSAAKRAIFDQAAGAKDAAVRAKEAPIAPGLSRPFVEPSDYDGEPHITGAGASALGQTPYSASKRAAKKLGPLPP